MGHLEQWRSRQKLLASRHMGKGSRYCRVCGNQKAVIRKYALHTCRQCFRENHELIGFRHIS